MSVLNTCAIQEADAVVTFWRDAGPKRWFAKNTLFDEEFRCRFIHLYDAARHGKLDDWLAHATGSLAYVILLDQFPRNAFRGTVRMYESDMLARQGTDKAIGSGFDTLALNELRLFYYLPFAHSESLIDQNRSVELTKSLGASYMKHALEHREVIQRFGRFPHRNKILARATTDEEKRFLETGGFAG